MNNKEKARAYDEALKAAQCWLNSPQAIEDFGYTVEDAIQNIFPKLRESEDERIRKWIANYIHRSVFDEEEYPKALKAIEYLEKQKESLRDFIDDFPYSDQKEQKPTESISHLTVKGEGVYKICPRCKERMIRDDSKVYTSMPPQYGYECPKCGAMEFDTVIYDNPEIEEPKQECNDNERIRKDIIALIKFGLNDGSAVSPGSYTTKEEALAWLEKQAKQKPILEVFGFKVGDAVRLKDGDGRKHIIKSFEEVEGLHGPNFYHVEFEDNSARSGIYTGEEYQNGYYTQMEKFEKEQKPVDFPTTDEEVKEFLETHPKVEVPEKYKTPDFVFSKQEYESHPIISKDTTSVKPAEWSEADEEKLKAICTYLRDYSRLVKLGDKLRFNEYCDFLESLRTQGSKDSLQTHWKPSEEQMSAFKGYIEDFQARAEAAVGGWNNFDVMIRLYNDLKKL